MLESSALRRGAPARRVLQGALALIIASALGAPVRAASGAPSIELNRLEPHEGGCRVHLVLANDGPEAYSAYRLDLVIFGADGIIARRLALDTAPLRAHKTSVKAFDLSDLACAHVSSILLNDVSRCVTGDHELSDCVSAASLSSKADAKFIK